MHGFIHTHRGMEEIAAAEVKKKISQSSSLHEGAIAFPIKQYEDLFALAYTAQSAINTSLLLQKFEYKNLIEDTKKIIENIHFDEWFEDSTTFRVTCKKISDFKLDSQDAEKEVGGALFDHLSKKHKEIKVDLTNPDVHIILFANKKEAFLCIDFNGFDASKRSYHVFTTSGAIKGTIAYALTQFARFSPGKSLLDCYTSSGTIPIEAAHIASNHPIHYYDKQKFAFRKLAPCKHHNFEAFFLKSDRQTKNSNSKINAADTTMGHVQLAKKNAKIAGVGKSISFSRNDIRWLDTKFKENEIDCIVTKIPHYHDKDMNNVYKEFFHQTSYILAPNGKIVIIANKEWIDTAKEFNLRLEKETTIWTGKQPLSIYIFSKH